MGPIQCFWCTQSSQIEAIKPDDYGLILLAGIWVNPKIPLLFDLGIVDGDGDGDGGGDGGDDSPPLNILQHLNFSMQ